MAGFRPFSTSTAFAACLCALVPLGAGADIRVWTDQEEVILKGTLKGIETLQDSRAKGLPPAPRTRGLPPRPTRKPVTQASGPGGGLTVADLGRKLPPGSTLVLKKGVYFGGTITGPLTIKCQPGAVITGQGKKAALRIDASPVVINGCVMRDSRNAQNSAGIWAEPGMRILNIRNASFINNGNGILVGNRKRAETTIDNSLFDGNGAGGQAHQIYISGTDTKLVIRGSTFRNTTGDGHVIKTGAHTNVLENTRILSSATTYSRAIDAFAGGVLLLSDVRIEHGPDANSDIIGFGAEAKRRRNPVKNQVLFSNVTVKCLRRNGCQLIQTWLPEPISTSGVSVTGGSVKLAPHRRK